MRSVLGAFHFWGKSVNYGVKSRMKIHTTDNERRSAEDTDRTGVDVQLSPDAHAKLEKIARDRGCRRDDVIEDAINNLFAELERTRETLNGGSAPAAQ